MEDKLPLLYVRHVCLGKMDGQLRERQGVIGVRGCVRAGVVAEHQEGIA